MSFPSPSPTPFPSSAPLLFVFRMLNLIIFPFPLTLTWNSLHQNEDGKQNEKRERQRREELSSDIAFDPHSHVSDGNISLPSPLDLPVWSFAYACTVLLDQNENQNNISVPIPLPDSLVQKIQNLFTEDQKHQRNTNTKRKSPSPFSSPSPSSDLKHFIIGNIIRISSPSSSSSVSLRCELFSSLSFLFFFTLKEILIHKKLFFALFHNIKGKMENIIKTKMEKKHSGIRIRGRTRGKCKGEDKDKDTLEKCMETLRFVQCPFPYHYPCPSPSSSPFPSLSSPVLFFPHWIDRQFFLFGKLFFLFKNILSTRRKRLLAGKIIVGIGKNINKNAKERGQGKKRNITQEVTWGTLTLYARRGRDMEISMTNHHKLHGTLGAILNQISWSEKRNHLRKPNQNNGKYSKGPSSPSELFCDVDLFAFHSQWAHCIFEEMSRNNEGKGKGTRGRGRELKDEDKDGCATQENRNGHPYPHLYPHHPLDLFPFKKVNTHRHNQHHNDNGHQPHHQDEEEEDCDDDDDEDEDDQLHAMVSLSESLSLSLFSLSHTIKNSQSLNHLKREVNTSWTEWTLGEKTKEEWQGST